MVERYKASFFISFLSFFSFYFFFDFLEKFNFFFKDHCGAGERGAACTT